jgi:hypothetical protein
MSRYARRGHAERAAWLTAVLQRGAYWQKKESPDGFRPSGLKLSAMTYFPAVQYHRRQRLNCCVRDGNRCFPLPVVTDKRTDRLSATGQMTGLDDVYLLPEGGRI